MPDIDLSPRPALCTRAPIAALARPVPHPRVAIVMRTRDRPMFLPRAIASVAGQDWPHWHLYVVNDGGDPAPVEAILRRALPAGRATAIHLPERHDMARAANAALRRATEDLLAVHDDDDSWEPGYLSATAAFLADPSHAGFVGVSTGCTLVEERIAEGRIEAVMRHAWPHARGTVDLRRAIVDLQLPPIALTFRRAALDAMGGQSEELTHLADLEFLHRLLLLGDIGFIDRPLANYHHRQRGTGGSAGNSVVEQVPERAEQALVLRNAMLRAALAREPERFGLLQPLLTAIEEDRQALARRLAGIEALCAEQARLLAATQDLMAAQGAILREATERLDAATRPGLLDRSWRALLPARRVVARMRGRVSA